MIDDNGVLHGLFVPLRDEEVAAARALVVRWAAGHPEGMGAGQEVADALGLGVLVDRAV